MKIEARHQATPFWNSAAEEFDSIYTGTGKNAWSRFLDRVFRKDIYQRFDWVMDKCGDLRGKTACDIGCGPGHFVSEFAKRGAVLSIGLDIAPNMLALASNRVAREGVADRCEFALSDVEEWKTDQRFDITLAIGLWDYIEDPRRQLRCIRKLTRGRFLSAWPRLWTWRMPIRKARLHYMRGCPVYFYRQPEIYRMLEGAGFSLIRCDTVGKLFCVEARPR
jgi:2-polyprenyl-3-methyl-5-hydroxy-6-metoxy-1,4-benzoquinol methylase